MARNLILNNPKHIRIPTPLNDDVAFSFFDFYLAQETIFPSPSPHARLDPEEHSF